VNTLQSRTQRGSFDFTRRMNLVPDSIIQCLNQQCPCFRASGSNCIDHFSSDEVYGIRLSIVKLGFQASMDVRRQELFTGFLINSNRGVRKCTPLLLGRRVCLKAYSIITAHSYAGLCNQLSSIANGRIVRRVGRPESLVLNSGTDLQNCQQRTIYLLIWLREWIKYNGEAHPTGNEHAWSINFFRKRDVYKEYKSSMALFDFDESQIVSLRTMYRVWKYFIEADRVYVRVKCRTSTKCRGLGIHNPINALFSLIHRE
jgi:hypothetical protein